jgi:hypothetical protein
MLYDNGYLINMQIWSKDSKPGASDIVVRYCCALRSKFWNIQYQISTEGLYNMFLWAALVPPN